MDGKEQEIDYTKIQLKLKCKGNEIIELSSVFAKRSGLLSNLVKDFDVTEPIDLTNFTKEVVTNCVTYLEKMVNNKPYIFTKPLTTLDFVTKKTAFEKDFVEYKPLSELIELMEAAHFLDIEGLSNLVASKLACELQTRSFENLQALFGTECDLTEDQIKDLQGLYPDEIEDS